MTYRYIREAFTLPDGSEYDRTEYFGEVQSPHVTWVCAKTGGRLDPSSEMVKKLEAMRAHLNHM